MYIYIYIHIHIHTYIYIYIEGCIGLKGLMGDIQGYVGLDRIQGIGFGSRF